MHESYDAPRSIPPSDQPTIDLPPGPGAPWWRWVIDRNPLFLISGVFMFAGCFLVSRHIHELDPADVGEPAVLKLLVGLLVVLNLYEFAVIALGLTLTRTRTLARDARHLLGLAMLLLIDVGFVYNETGIADLTAGAVIGGVASVLAVGKAWLITRSLGIRPTRAAQGVTALSLASMYTLPVVLRAVADDGFLPTPAAMALWGGVGLLVGFYALPKRWCRLDLCDNADQLQLQRLVAGGLIVLPLVSLVGHALAALWVYENVFEPSMLAPLLLGLAALLLRHHDTMGGGEPTARAATILVASAVVACLLPSETLVVQSPDAAWLAFSPLRGALVIGVLLLAWAWGIGHRGPAGVFNIAVPAAAALLGHTPWAMLEHLRLGSAWVYRVLLWVLPAGKLGWGVLAIGTAFGMLMVGGLVSWRRRGRDLARSQAIELLTGQA